MRPYNLHIVFGRAAMVTLIESKEINLNDNKIIGFDDVLNIGPICDVHEYENILKRKEWLQNNLDNKSHSKLSSDIVQGDLDSITSIIEDSNNIDKIFLWTGLIASEIISTARLISHLSKLNKDIFIIDYPNIPVKSIHGSTIFPKSLVTTATFQIKEIAKHFKLVDNHGLSYWMQLWNKQRIENGQLRILDNNGLIAVKEVDYFDSYLLSNCDENFQKAARVIGQTLVDIDFSCGDGFLNWRLKLLAIDGKIETQGEPIEIRDYEVRKIMTANVH